MIKVAAALVLMAFGLVFGGTCAYGATGHVFLSSLSEAPAGTPLSQPGAMGFDRVDDRVFVADPGRGVVDVYDSGGAFVTQIGGGQLFAVGVAVDEANGNVYVADLGTDSVLVFRPSGPSSYTLLSEWTGRHAPKETFGEVSGVAVDNSGSISAGDVYVLDAESPEGGLGAVQVLRPRPAGPEEGDEGNLVRSLTHKLLEPNGVAVSSATGQVLVADSRLGAVYEFGADGAFEGKLTGSGSPQGSFIGKSGQEAGNVSAVAVDDTSGHVLVAEAERGVVSEFDSAGEWVGWVPDLAEPSGVAVNSAGDVYVSDAALSLVDVFGPGTDVPGVATGKASKLTRTSASLKGKVNGGGKAGLSFVQWGTTPALGSSTPKTAFAGGEEDVSVALEGLHAGTTYYYRLAAENENGTSYSGTGEFTTPPAVEGLSTGTVQSLEPTGAALTGTLSPNGVDAHYYFEWGLSSSYGHSSPLPPGTDAGAGAGGVAASSEVGGLKPNTTYRYRLVATNSFGTNYGADRSFRTSGPPSITEEPVSGIGHETATLNARINPDEIATSYRFQYGETNSYGSEVSGTAGSGTAPVAVSAVLSGLKPGGTYHFRVVAENEVGTTASSDQVLTTLASASIDAESATSVTATEATLHTEINPLGSETSYYFQYGTSSCEANPAACANVPALGEDIGAGEADVARSVELGGLVPATTYYYRVLAFNSVGISEGSEHSFTTRAVTLPDGRAWEMVSPPDKRAPVEALTSEGGLIRASEDGTRLAYVANGALGEETQGNRSPEPQQILATRGAEGWGSQDIATPNNRAQGLSGGAPEYQFFTPDLALALVQPLGNPPEPPLAPEATQETMYIRDNASGTYLPLLTEGDVAHGVAFGGHVSFAGASSDLSHVVIESSVALGGRSSAPGLYEWAGGHLQLVSVLPKGTPAKGRLDLGYLHVQAGAISSDGSRVIWTVREEEAARGHLYMRDTVSGETVRLDAAQVGMKEPAQGSASFQDASPDGSRVLFTDAARLTPDATAGASKPDLYACDMVERAGKLACDLSDLTVDHNAGEQASVQGLVLGASEDATSAFIVAQGVLAENENGRGEVAEGGRDNMYQLHYDGTTWTTAFVATLSGEDSPEWEGGGVDDTAYLTARVSPNGRYLAFMSAASLTGYDNFDRHSGKRDEEVYLYDASTASLSCVSCNPSGVPPAGVFDRTESGEGLGLLVDRRKIWLGRWLAGSIPGWTSQTITSALFQSRYLNDEGRLYFNSPDELVPAASGGKESVYEYEPAGIGSCESPSGGCVALLSPGDSNNESAFLEATPSGRDVFFLSAARLLPQDTDTAFDIYDARACTEESPCLTPPPPAAPGCGAAETCRPALPPVIAPAGSPGSATFSGPGNVPPPPLKQEVKGAKTSVEHPTRAERLARELKTCRKRHAHSKKKRKACEAHARTLYGSKAKGKHLAKSKKSTAQRSPRGGGAMIAAAGHLNRSTR